MFRPDKNSDRTDYSSLLMPPAGYRLDKAVGTTYSLDLEALTSVSICLGLAEETDSKIMHNPISMLNALQKISDKFLIFCEAGQIQMPSKPTPLSILLEKMVIPVALPKDRKLNRYPAFHPKTWILSYINDMGDKKYRFVIMSRNLTFDRSWDISFYMDSSQEVSQKEKTKPIIDFLEYLRGNIHNTVRNASRKRMLLSALGEELKEVSFSLESKEFGDNFEILPLGIGQKAYPMTEDILFCDNPDSADSTFHELVIMSPFVSDSIIETFNKKDRGLTGCTRTLITRRSELSKLKLSHVDQFSIYALKDDIVDGEDYLSELNEDKKKQDVHVKLYIRRKYSDVDLYLGSMNASYAAVNKNVEMMLWLGTKNRYLNGQSFLNDIFCGPEDGRNNPFERVYVTDETLNSDQDENRLLEQKIKELCRLKKSAYIAEESGRYRVNIVIEGVKTDQGMIISPFNSRQTSVVSENIVFHDLELLQLSEFYEVTVMNDEITLHRIIMIPTTGLPGDRERAIINSVVKDRASFVEYISFVLGDDYIASLMENKQLEESGFFRNSKETVPALYEKMLKVSAEDPERLKEIGYLLKMVTDKNIIPDEFRELYDIFCSTLKIKK